MPYLRQARLFRPVLVRIAEYGGILLAVIARQKAAS